MKSSRKDVRWKAHATSRRAEGTAVGYNKKEKGARSYYPLFCTIAQTGQVLDFLARSGNVHDSQGAREFILACLEAVREVLPHAVIEVRMDSAFFSDAIVSALNAQGIEFTLSVPFERLHTFRSTVLQPAGRLTWPQGRLTLTVSANCWIRSRFLACLKALHLAARSSRFMQRQGLLWPGLCVRLDFAPLRQLVQDGKRLADCHVQLPGRDDDQRAPPLVERETHIGLFMADDQELRPELGDELLAADVLDRVDADQLIGAAFFGGLFHMSSG